MAQIWLKSSDSYLSALLMKATTDSQKIVILLPGFMQAKSDSYYFMSDFAKYLVTNGFHVLMVDLIGSGDSFGKSEEIELVKMKSDVLHIIQYVKQEGYKKVFAVGRGLSANIFAQIDNKNHSLWKIACINPVYIDAGMSEKIMSCLNRRGHEELIELNSETFQDLAELFVMAGTEKCNIEGECLKASFLAELAENCMNPYDMKDREDIALFYTCDCSVIYSKYYTVLSNCCNGQFTFSKYNDRINLMLEIVRRFEDSEDSAYESTFRSG